jgi:hypothetical protein
VLAKCTREGIEYRSHQIIIEGTLARLNEEIGWHARCSTSNHPALKRRTGDHAMTSFTTKPNPSQPQTATAAHLFDNWFDPIEAVSLLKNISWGNGSPLKERG